MNDETPDMHRRVSMLEGDMRAIQAETKAGFAQLSAELARRDRWIIAAILAAAVAVAAFLRYSPQPATPSVIINNPPAVSAPAPAVGHTE